MIAHREDRYAVGLEIHQHVVAHHRGFVHHQEIVVAIELGALGPPEQFVLLVDDRLVEEPVDGPDKRGAGVAGHEVQVEVDACGHRREVVVLIILAGLGGEVHTGVAQTACKHARRAPGEGDVRHEQLGRRAVRAKTPVTVDLPVPPKPPTVRSPLDEALLGKATSHRR